MTSAGQGIGEGIARRYAAEGAAVVVALFLASEDSCYVTGNTIFADGGGHINGVPWDPEGP